MSATTIPMSALPLFPSGHKITDSPTEFIRGIREIRALVGATMGPFGTNVIPTGQQMHSAIWKDGARVIEGYTPNHPIGANAVQRIRDAAQATLRRAGDGTSTTTVFLSTLYLTAMEMIMEAERAQPDQIIVRRLVAEKITAYLDRMIEALQAAAVKDVSHETLIDVATLAGANNRELGEKIAGLIAQIGAKGSVKIEYSKSGELQTDTVPGYAFDGGVYDPSMLPARSSELVLENPYIVLLYDQLLTEIEVANLVGEWTDKVFTKGINQALVIVSPDIDSQALSMLIARTYADPTRGITDIKMPVFCIRPPKDVPLEDFYQDLSAVTGGIILNRKKGTRFDHFKLSSAGQAVRLVTSTGRTTIIGDNEKGSALEARITSQLDELDEAGKVVALDRLARLQAKVGVIRIPGPTQGSVLWSQEVVDDAWRSTQSALEHGVLPGCGRALISAFGAADLEDLNTGGLVEYDIAYSAVTAAAQSIFRIVLANGGIGAEIADMYIEYFASIKDTSLTVVVNEDFIKHVRINWDNPGDSVRIAPVHNAFEIGVLDSALGVIEAVKNSRAEIGLWIQTKHWSLT